MISENVAQSESVLETHLTRLQEKFFSVATEMSKNEGIINLLGKIESGCEHGYNRPTNLS